MDDLPPAYTYLRVVTNQGPYEDVLTENGVWNPNLDELLSTSWVQRVDFNLEEAMIAVAKLVTGEYEELIAKEPELVASWAEGILKAILTHPVDIVSSIGMRLDAMDPYQADIDQIEADMNKPDAWYIEPEVGKFPMHPGGK